MKSFANIAVFLDSKICGCAENIEVHNITCKSSECGEGIAFAALCGQRQDGHKFALDAYKKGSRAFILERDISLPNDAAYIVVKNSRAALARASLFILGEPEKEMTLVGVTGTKGKSTVVLMIEKILEFSGKKTASVSTVGFSFDGNITPTENSTPESYIIANFLAKTKSVGATHAVIEVSSQGVKQRRIDGLSFDIGVMTNLSRDHIGSGEHKNFSEYKEFKKSFFSKCKMGVFNADDRYFDEFSALCPGVTYGIRSCADVTAKNIENVRAHDDFGVTFDVCANNGVHRVFLPMPGDFAVYDALAAISVGVSLGVPVEICAFALEDIIVNGRFEKIAVERDIDVVIDYAHNGASLGSALRAARQLSRGKLICVFGSVGGRTKMRRKELAAAADKYADICILTSDNPNFENPLDILSNIADNIKNTPYFVIPDREDAIRRALDIADDGDFVLICGKGHERYQLVHGEKMPFDEKKIVENALKLNANI